MRKVKYKTSAQQFAEDKMKQIAKGCTPLVRKRTLRYWLLQYHTTGMNHNMHLGKKGKWVQNGELDGKPIFEFVPDKRKIAYIDTSTLNVVEE